MASLTNSGGGSAASSNESPTPGKQIIAGDAETIEEKVDDGVEGSSVKPLVRSDEDAAEGSYSCGDVNGGSKKPVWNKPSNEALEVEPVMGADSWPALSEIAKGPQKSSGEPFKTIAEASMPFLQGNAPSTHKQVTSNPHPNSCQNQAHPGRQKSFKCHGGNASANYGSSTQPIPLPTLSISSHVPSIQSISSSLKNLNLESGQKVASQLQSSATNCRPQLIFPHRKVNGPHQQGDSSYNHRYGARKDQDRPNRDLNSHRNFNGRDAHQQPTGVLPSEVIRHTPMPHGSAPYIACLLSPTMRPFGPVSYPDFPFYYVPVQPESIRGTGIPYPAPAPAPAPYHPFMQYPDLELYSKVTHQIDYYFSNENLIKDTYLRNNMDEQGWVPIKLIAGFQKVMRLTDNVAYIMEAIQTSTVLEVKDDKVRRRNDWMNWLMPEPLKVPSQSTCQDPGRPSEFSSGVINSNGEASDIPSPAPSSGDPSH